MISSLLCILHWGWLVLFTTSTIRWLRSTLFLHYRRPTTTMPDWLCLTLIYKRAEWMTGTAELQKVFCTRINLLFSSLYTKMPEIPERPASRNVISFLRLSRLSHQPAILSGPQSWRSSALNHSFYEDLLQQFFLLCIHCLTRRFDADTPVYKHTDRIV